jgi:hypothetical protein
MQYVRISFLHPCALQVYFCYRSLEPVGFSVSRKMEKQRKFLDLSLLSRVLIFFSVSLFGDFSGFLFNKTVLLLIGNYGNLVMTANLSHFLGQIVCLSPVIMVSQTCPSPVGRILSVLHLGIRRLRCLAGPSTVLL